MSPITFLILIISQTQGQSNVQQEKVTGKAQLEISTEEYKKPGGLVLPGPFAPVDQLLGEKEHQLSAKISNLSESYYKRSIKFTGRYLRVPVDHPVALDLIKIKVPVPPIKPKRWKLKITDPVGLVVKEFEGKGMPPEYVEWDGRYGNDYIIPGATYTTVLEYTDKYDRVRTKLGQDLKITGIVGRVKDKYILKVVADSIFIPGSYKLTPKAPEILDELANFIKEHIFGMVLIKVKGEANNLTKKRMNVLKSELLRRIAIDPARLQIKPVYFVPKDLKIPIVEIIAG